MSGSLWPALCLLHSGLSSENFNGHLYRRCGATRATSPVVLPSGVVRGRKNPQHFGFAQRLKTARRAAKLSHAALARQAGLASRTTTTLLESREHIPRVDTVERLADALGVSPCLLAFGVTQPTAPAVSLRCSNLPERLREARTTQGLSLREVGRRAGSSGTQVRQIENGKAVPNLATVEELANALRLSPAWLAFGLGQMTPPNPRRPKSQEIADTSAQRTS